MNAQVPSLATLTSQEVAKLNQPTVIAEGLPGRAYYDEAFYETERKHIFSACWVGAGFASELPNPGDVMPVTVAGYELLLVHTRSGEIKCYQNVCRHRGMRLVKDKGSVRTIRCSYHCWTYDLDGRLVATPALNGVTEGNAEGFHNGDLSLLPVATGRYLDTIFVNIDGKAGSFEDFIAPVDARIRQTVDLGGIKAAPHGVGRGTRNFACNWKIVVEGGIEDYHLPFVHKAFDHSEDYKTEDGGDTYAGFSSRRSMEELHKRLGTEAQDGVSLPMFPRAGDPEVAETLALFVFPNTVFSISVNYMSQAITLPMGVDNTLYSSKTYFQGEAATDETYRKHREENTVFWKQVLDEDDGPWAEMHRMARQREELNMPARFSPHWEVAMHNFQKSVAHRLPANG